MRIAILFVLAVTGAAYAQAPSKPQPTAQQLEEAKAHFKAAEAAKARADYKTAAAEYLAAYERYPDAEFFFNTAEVFRLGNDEPNALTYYQKYVDADPNGRGAAKARTAIDELRRSIAAKEAAAKQAADARAKQQADAEAKRKAEQQSAQANQPETPEEPEEPAPASPGKGLRIAGIASGGAGVVMIGVGVFFGLKAKKISDEAAKWDMFDQARFNQGKAAQRNMFILTGVGGAAIIAGGVMYYLGHRAASTATTTTDTAMTIVPSVTPDQIGVAAAGHF